MDPSSNTVPPRLTDPERAALTRSLARSPGDTRDALKAAIHNALRLSLDEVVPNQTAMALPDVVEQVVLRCEQEGWLADVLAYLHNWRGDGIPPDAVRRKITIDFFLRNPNRPWTRARIAQFRDRMQRALEACASAQQGKKRDWGGKTLLRLAKLAGIATQASDGGLKIDQLFETIFARGKEAGRLAELAATFQTAFPEETKGEIF